MAKVQKDFKSNNRKFKAGDDVAPADIIDSAMTFDELVAGGFISSGEAVEHPADADEHGTS